MFDDCEMKYMGNTVFSEIISYYFISFVFYVFFLVTTMGRMGPGSIKYARIYPMWLATTCVFNTLNIYCGEFRQADNLSWEFFRVVSLLFTEVIHAKRQVERY